MASTQHQPTILLPGHRNSRGQAAWPLRSSHNDFLVVGTVWRCCAALGGDLWPGYLASGLPHTSSAPRDSFSYFISDIRAATRPVVRRGHALIIPRSPPALPLFARMVPMQAHQSRSYSARSGADNNIGPRSSHTCHSMTSSLIACSNSIQRVSEPQQPPVESNRARSQHVRPPDRVRPAANFQVQLEGRSNLFWPCSAIVKHSPADLRRITSSNAHS